MFIRTAQTRPEMTPPGFADEAISPYRARLADLELAVTSALLPLSLVSDDDMPNGEPELLGQFASLSALRFARLSISGVGARWNRKAADIGNYVKLIFITRGQGRLWRNGSAQILKEGMWTIYDPACPYRLDSDEPYDCVAVAMPVGAVSIQRFLADANWAEQTYPIAGNMAIAFETISACLDGKVEAGRDDVAATAHAIATLIEAGIRRSMDNGGAFLDMSRETLLLSQAHQAIRAYGADPGFSVEGLADILHVSRRTLYNVLKLSGQTPYKAIQQYRIDLSCAILSDPGQSHRNVTDIALDAGFPDATHFARLFKQQLGMTPTEYRHARLTTKLPRVPRLSTLARECASRSA
ncbi:AraC family transcriptional regulator [Blastomonas sp. CCH13-E1]|uniref:AraC family transcriptional regulator n=1 Tax=Blastomonas sp. CCH13-E1 TaxID=1768739 RepID=UPI0009ECC27D|nr:AraC family transcriptional regulator [Blastomonas sp. CCH13-E1]